MTTNNFDSVQEAARKRAATLINSEALAKQIVVASQGDARMAYDFLDMLNQHVTKLLQGKKP